jgi:hypothetical protein
VKRLLDLLRGFVAIDRRWLFLAMGLAIVVPLLFPIGLPIDIQPQVRSVYEAVRGLPAGSKLLVSADYDPGSGPEVQPFMEALFTLAFERDLDVVAFTLWPAGPPMIDRAYERTKGSTRYGEDFVNLGFKEGRIIVMTKMGESIVKTFPTDDHGTPLRDLPIMRGLDALGDAPLLVLVGSGFPGPIEWLPQVQGRYIDRVVAATTSVMAPDLIPFLDSGQLAGLVAGISGAAQFEKLCGIAGAATRGMDVQSFAHLLIILSIVLANVSYFARRA